MPAASNPVRDEAEAFIRAELDRVGADGLDRRALYARFKSRGAGRTRLRAWLTDIIAEGSARELVAEPTPRPEKPKKPAAEVACEIEDEIAAAEAAFTPPIVPAAVLPTVAAIEAVERAARIVVEEKPVVPAPALPPPPAGLDAPIAVVPDSARNVLEHLQSIIATCGRVLAHSHGPDGRVRNPRMALQSVDQLRRCLETALKLYEAINNVQAVERFMTEMVAELRALEPAAAAAVVERLRAVQARWAA